MTYNLTAEQAARIDLVRAIANTRDAFECDLVHRQNRAIIYGICSAISTATNAGLADAALAEQLQHAVDLTVVEADVAYLPTALVGSLRRDLSPQAKGNMRLCLRLMWLAYWAWTGTGSLGGSVWKTAAQEAEAYALVVFPSDAGVIHAYRN